MCSYVESSVTDAAYFSSPCKFGKDGVEEVMGFGEISAYEQEWFDKVSSVARSIYSAFSLGKRR